MVTISDSYEYYVLINAAHDHLSHVLIASGPAHVPTLPDARVNELLQALRATHHMAAELYAKLQAAYPHVVPYGEPPQCQ